jgi:hypothetical protein
MKPRRLIWASSALCLLIASCEKNKATSAASGGNEKSDSLAAERAALEDERMALERQRLEEERAALEEEKAALEAEREARLAQREDDVDQRDADADRRDLTLEERQRALADRELDLSDREGDLADREAGLSDRELELAGRESLDDWEPETVEYYEEPVADYGTFYDDLQPYGSWFETPDYGYVYQPTIVVQDDSWRPYTRGRWACTNRGWTWVSDEPFGWACFHYGRWTLINGRGWVWVPGDEWAPSWVCWREGDDCVGWAPLPPETLCYRGRGWNSSVEGDFGIGHGCFTFVHCRNMADPIWRHCLPVRENNIWHKKTTNITNIHIDRDRVVCGGPRYDKLRNLVGRPWPVYQLETDRFQGLRDLAHRNSQVRGNRLSVFAPSMNTRWNAELKPQKVSGKWDDVKVVRTEAGIKPEWTERFRETRQKQKEQAVAWKREHSAGDDTQKQLQANREKVAEAQKTYQAKQRELVEARREKMAEKREERQASKRTTLPGMTSGKPGGTAVAPDKVAQESASDGKPSLAERQRDLAERMRESRNRTQAERQTEAPRTTPDRTTRPASPPDTGVADNRRERQPQPQQQEQITPRRERNDGAVAQADNRRQQLEDARLQQQEQIRQRQEENRQRQEEARQAQENSRAEGEENTRRQQMEETRRQQQEAAREKAEQARQQQEDRQRQMEDNRQRQQEEARERQDQSRREAEDGQRRQQQEEMRRQQQEQARQQQEQARQQQEERARQQQEERARHA